MRRVLGPLLFALAWPWAACEDRTVSLSQDQETSLTSSGGTSSGGTSSSGSGSTSFGGGTNDDGGSGGSFTPGNTNFGVPTGNSTTFPGAGGSNNPTGGANHTGNAGGGGPFGPSTFTSGGNEGGQGPDCQDKECLICLYALGNCNVPTPDCEEGWERRCDCSGGCPNGYTCFEGFKCRPTCLGDGTCPDPLNPYCDPEANACVRCSEPEHCADVGRTCFAGECVECINRGDCSGNDYCIAGECVECVSPADCDGATCNSRNRCSECSNDGDCMGDEKTFCISGACTECRGDADCDGGEYCDPFNYTCSPRE